MRFGLYSLSLKLGASKKQLLSPEIHMLNYLINSQVVRFILVGGVATFMHAAITVVLIEGIGLSSAALANLVGTATGITISYLGNWSWTFRADGRHFRYLPRFLVVYATVTLQNAMIMFLVADLWGIPYLIPLAFILVFSPVVTFLLNRGFVFR